MTTFTEGRDASADTGTAYEIEVGDYFHGEVRTNSDVDYIAVQLEEGIEYTVAMTGIGAPDDMLRDTFLRLVDSNGRQIALDDDGGPDAFSTMTFTASASGEYFIEASSYRGQSNGEYGVSIVEGDLASYDVAMGAGAITRVPANWLQSNGEAGTVTWAPRSTGPGVDADGRNAPFSRLSSDQIEAAEAALGEISSVAGIEFDRVGSGYSDNATILISNYTSNSDGAGAYAWFAGNRAFGANSGDVWLNTTSVSRSDLEPGSYSYYTVLHELGHAMGLSHLGEYDGGSPTYENLAQFREDTSQYSVMSYFDESNTTGSYDQYPQTLMMYDIYALQQIYGVDTQTRAGATTYGFNSNAGGVYDFEVNSNPALTIWDAAGTDTLDVSGYRDDQRIDLNDGTYSDVGGRTGNVGIAVGAVIENAVGGSGNDSVTGNEAANRLSGGAGNDFVYGGGGNDRLDGGDGVDQLFGDAGNDALYGNDDNDVVRGGAGNDFVRGDNGNDRVFGDAGEDRVFGGTGNDRLYGGDGADVMFGDAGVDVLLGGEGVDLVRGGAGNDFVRGDVGDDRVFGDAGNDRVFGGDGDDRVYGGDGTDLMFGDAGADILFGDDGDDVVRGGFGRDLVRGDAGADVLFGDADNDRVLGGTGDDRAYGGDGADQVYGSAGADIVFGDDGNDLVRGGVGNDFVRGDGGNDRVLGDAGNDRVFGGTGNDSVYGGAGADLLFGDAGADQLFGDSGNDVLNGGAGNDLLRGGTGADVFVFSGGSGNDRIAGFEDGVDTLAFNGLGFNNADDVLAAATADGDTVVIDLGDSDAVQLVGYLGDGNTIDDLRNDIVIDDPLYA